VTSKMRTLALALVLGVGLSLVAARADDEKPAKPDEDAVKIAENTAHAISLIVEAHRMAEFGKENESALSMVTAGAILLILKEKGFEKAISDSDVSPELKYEDKTAKGEDAPKGDPKKVSFKAQAEEWFDEARGFAGSDPTIEKLIKEATLNPEKLALNKSRFRGAFGGPKQIRKRLGGGATHVLHISFQEGMPGILGLRASKPLQIGIVRADNDHVFHNTRTAHANFPINPGIKKGTKKGSGTKFTIRIRNPHPKPADYHIVTN
jgi:hypothetical protein